MRLQTSSILLILACSTLIGCSGQSDEKYTSYCQDDSFIDYDSSWGCHFEIDFKQDVTINWRIIIPPQDAENDIDIYVMDKRNYDDYRSDETLFGSCESFVFVEAVSRENIRDYTLSDTVVNLNAGDWYFAIDNKACTGAEPISEIRVDSYVQIQRGV